MEVGQYIRRGHVTAVGASSRAVFRPHAIMSGSPLISVIIIIRRFDNNTSSFTQPSNRHQALVLTPMKPKLTKLIKLTTRSNTHQHSARRANQRKD